MVKKIGPYYLGQCIGKGSFGEVKVGLNIHTKVRVAVKLCDKVKLSEGKGREMLEKEVATMKQLRHRNVLRVIDVMETGKCFYLVIELAEGGDLYKLLYRGRRFKEHVGLRYFQQLMQGVAYCHNRGIVHRDLKPQNLLLTKDNTLKIADFGFSGFQPVGTTHPTPRKQTATICGTPNYAAPEIFRRQGFDGFKIDVWSCGVILYFMLTGLVPFYAVREQDGIKGIMKSVLKGEYSMPEHITAEAQDLIARVLVQDPDARLSSQDVLMHPWMCSAYDVTGDPDKVAPTQPPIEAKDADADGRSSATPSPAPGSQAILALGDDEEEEVECDQAIVRPRGYPCDVMAFQKNVEDVDEEKWRQAQQGSQMVRHLDPEALASRPPLPAMGGGGSDGSGSTAQTPSQQQGGASQDPVAAVAADGAGRPPPAPEVPQAGSHASTGTPTPRLDESAIESSAFGTQQESDGEDDSVMDCPRPVAAADGGGGAAPRVSPYKSARRRFSAIISAPFSGSAGATAGGAAPRPQRKRGATVAAVASPVVSDTGDSRSTTPTREGGERLLAPTLTSRFRAKLTRRRSEMSPVPHSPTPGGDGSGAAAAGGLCVEAQSNGNASSSTTGNQSNPSVGIIRRVSQTFHKDGLDRERKWVRKVSMAESPTPLPHPNPSVSPRSPVGVIEAMQSGPLKDIVADQRKQGLSRFASICETELRTAHDYQPATLLTSSCFFCAKFIMGKGLQCKICKCPIHKECAKEAAEHTYCEQYYFREKEDFFDGLAERLKRSKPNKK